MNRENFLISIKDDIERYIKILKISSRGEDINRISEIVYIHFFYFTVYLDALLSTVRRYKVPEDEIFCYAYFDKKLFIKKDQGVEICVSGFILL